MSDREPLLRAREVAALLGVSSKTVYGWAESGYMPHFKVGKSVRFKWSRVERWLDRQAKPGRATQIPNV